MRCWCSCGHRLGVGYLLAGPLCFGTYLVDAEPTSPTFGQPVQRCPSCTRELVRERIRLAAPRARPQGPGPGAVAAGSGAGGVGDAQ